MKKILLATALLFAAGAAYAGGAFQGYPVIGNDSTICLSAGNNGVCNQFTPVGPSSLVGTETMPADVNPANNAAPFTVNVPILALNAGPYQYNAPLTGASITVANTSRRLMLEPAGTIAALTVTLPAVGAGATLLIDNQTFGLCSTQVITALTMTAGSGTTLLNPATATTVPSATAAGCFEWVYRKTNTTWYRVQ